MKQFHTARPWLTLMLCAVASCCGIGNAAANPSDPYAERLDRGIIASKTPEGVFLSWRFLPSDDDNTAFDIYRNGELVNTDGPLTTVTNYTDTLGTTECAYELRTLCADGTVMSDVADSVWSSCSIVIPLDLPKSGHTVDGRGYHHTPGDCSVGDVDGDGEYEIVLKWSPTNEHDNSHDGYTGPQILDCYKLNGKKLWRIDLGPNIRAGAHYTQFLVYDFDGDGRAEVACKTAPGSIDGLGRYVTEASDNNDITSADNKAFYPNSKGHVLDGPEFLTIFSGMDGGAIHTVFYEPGRDIRKMQRKADDDTMNGVWGDGDGNRSERYLATAAYLPDDEGKPRASMVFCRGYYTYAFAAAWQFDGKRLTRRWMYETESTDHFKTLYGAGAHSVVAGDVDNDGFDEIIYGAAALDHDGTMLYNTGWMHGDALHLGDMNPDRPGLEVFMPHESRQHAGMTPDGKTMDFGAELHDARTGEILWAVESAEDNGRGLAADIDPNHRGYEMWSLESNNVYDIHGNVINEGVQVRPPTNFRIYWDGDLQDELFDGGGMMPINRTNNGFGGFNKSGRFDGRGGRPGDMRRSPSDAARANRHDREHGRYAPKSVWDRKPNSMHKMMRSSAIYKWNPDSLKAFVLQVLPASTINGTKQNPNFCADILGDWREEVILTDQKNLIIFTTVIPSDYRVRTLPSDHTYRMSMTSQNTVYNQPPHLGYFLPDRFKKK